jgi:hypothetical protein
VLTTLKLQDMLAQRVQQRAEAAVLQELITSLTDELVRSAAAETLAAGAAAVVRAQRESGLVFTVASHQQLHYGMYCAFRKQRAAKVCELRAKIQVCTSMYTILYVCF